MTTKTQNIIIVTLVIIGLVLVGFVGFMLNGSQTADQMRSPVAGAWQNPTKPTVSDWQNLANNVTYTWTMIAINRSQITDATTTNISTALSLGISASSNNVSAAITASSLNISALRGNSTTVLYNNTAVPYYNLTTSWTQIAAMAGSTQALNFTTPRTGSYLIMANINENLSLASTTAGMYSQFGLCDANGTTIVISSERMGTLTAGTGALAQSEGRTYSWIYTNITGSAEVGLCGRVSVTPAGRWAIASDSTGRSTLSYVRLP